MAKVKLARGTQAAYNALQSKDADTIYVCTNTGNLYLGSTLLFESSAYIDASISGKTVTFTTHGTNGTTGTDTLDLGSFQTAEEVSAAIASAISSTYKPAGTLSKSAIVSGLLVAGNLGNVYNISEEFTVGSGTGQVPSSLFTDASAGNSYPAGTNIVVINTGTASNPVYKFDVLAGFVDLSNYMTKVSGATSGNFASFDANGNVVDSGNKASDFATSTHVHGNITNAGALQTNDITIASGDKLVVTDTSDSGKIARTSIVFDGTTTNTALTPKGTFERFLQSADLNTYWANQQLTSAATYNTEPEFKTVTINGSTNANTASTENGVLLYDTEEKCIKFMFN